MLKNHRKKNTYLYLMVSQENIITIIIIITIIVIHICIYIYIYIHIFIYLFIYLFIYMYKSPFSGHPILII